IKAVELKWAGYVFPNAHIPAGTSRLFDALWILHERPTTVNFNIFTDSTEYYPQMNEEGAYELQYIAISDNFPPARLNVRLNLTSTLDRTELLPTGSNTVPSEINLGYLIPAGSARAGAARRCGGRASTPRAAGGSR